MCPLCCSVLFSPRPLLCCPGMADAMLELVPNAGVHHIGMYRLKGSDMPVQYYNRLPKEAADVAFVLDPLIASSM